jgi:hypothetical protein
MVNGSKTTECPSVDPLLLVRSFILEREAAEKKRKREEAEELSITKKAAFINTLPLMMDKSKAIAIQDALLKYIVNSKGAASLVDHPDLLDLLDLVAVLGPSKIRKIIGHRRLYGLHNPGGHAADAPPILGEILQRNLDAAQKAK